MPNQIPLGFLATAAKLFTWSKVALGTNLTYVGAAYANLANAKFFGFGGSSAGANTTTYVRSNSLSTGWTTGTLPASRIWGKAAANSTRLVVVSRSASTTAAYTDNGTTWTSNTIFSVTQTMKDIIWDGTRFLVIGSDTAENLAHSTNGATWARIDTGNGTEAIAFDGTSRYIIAQSASTSTQRTCTADPTVAGNWGNLTMPAAAQWVSFSYGNGIWVALRRNSTSYATSPDGTTWTTRTLPRITADTGDLRLAFFNGFFHYVSGAGVTNLKIWSSDDGITWTELYTDASTNFDSANGFATFDNQIGAFGYATDTSGDSNFYLGVQ